MFRPFHSASSEVPEDMKYLRREGPCCSSPTHAFDEVADGLDCSRTGSSATEELKNGDLRNHNVAVYRRFGLLEFDCWEDPLIIRTAESDVIPAEYFWELDDPCAV